MSMNEDRFAGTAKSVGGRVEQGFGRATGDVKTETEGKIKQATGTAQDVYGQAKDAAGEAYGQAKDAVVDAAKSKLGPFGQQKKHPVVNLLDLGVAPVRPNGNALSIFFHNNGTAATGVGWDHGPSLRTEYLQRSCLC